MKKLQYLLLIATMLTACSQDVIVEMQNPTTNLNRTISVSFEEEDTRIQLNDELKTVWTKDDLVSVFYRSTVNEQWQFQGETGDRSGNITPTDSSINPPATTNHIVVVYPYNENYFYNSETHNIQASLPAEQTYIKNSYGLNGNILISSSEYNQISLKSVCGWLKLKLTGSGEKVKSIALRGNNDEQVAGELYINTADATSTLASELAESGDDGEVGGTLVRPGTILTEVTLNCGEGVVLGAEPTAFYIALPPQTFETGFTIDIECDGYTPYTISTENEIIIERNTIQPMATVEFEGEQEQPNNEIWYTATAKVEPVHSDVFGANIVSNEWDATTNKGVITFDSEVTSIGKEAFYGWDSSIIQSKLTDIDIPNSVTEIGENAFGYCDALTNITIPDSVKTIGRFAFISCDNITTINWGCGVTFIGGQAFSGCGITELTIPNSVTQVEYLAFSNCKNLASVNIPDSLIDIAGNTFSGCSALPIENNMRYADTLMVEVIDSSLNSYSIKDGTRFIGDHSFYECENMTSLYIPNSVEVIGGSAFYGCSSMETFNIPNSVKILEGYTFQDCTSLKEIILPESIIFMGQSIFSLCSSLERITIPNSVTSAIGDQMFWGCENLMVITIGTGVTGIGKLAFNGCKNLTSITIPENVLTLYEEPFSGCYNLKNIYFKSTVPPAIYYYKNSYGTKFYTFKPNSSIENIYVPREAYNNYTQFTSYTNGIAQTNWVQCKSLIKPYDYTNE